MLKPETERVWNFLKDQPALAGFVLVGGSALSLHLHHRFSEDLDFAYPDEKLPRARLESLGRKVHEAGLSMQAHDDPAALAEFADGGLDLRDYQQDYLLQHIVKVSFFAPEDPFLRVLNKPSSSNTVRLANLDELFKTKSLVSARRSRTRDWFDLYVLMTRCNYSMKDYHEAFLSAGIPDQAEIGLRRLCSGQPPVSDEGFEQLVPNPVSIEELTAFFRTQRDIFERSEASRTWRKGHGKSRL